MVCEVSLGIHTSPQTDDGMSDARSVRLGVNMGVISTVDGITRGTRPGAGALGNLPGKCGLMRRSLEGKGTLSKGTLTNLYILTPSIAKVQDRPQVDTCVTSSQSVHSRFRYT